MLSRSESDFITRRHPVYFLPLSTSWPYQYLKYVHVTNEVLNNEVPNNAVLTKEVLTKEVLTKEVLTKEVLTKEDLPDKGMLCWWEGLPLPLTIRLVTVTVVGISTFGILLVMSFFGKSHGPTPFHVPKTP